jgi:tRNA U34 5-methylaminomethyl-2-thiouridine-forming methyltransferase MnmC
LDELIFKLHESADGSHTITNDLFHSTYHSIHGAVQESLHVFIKSGLAHQLNTNFQVESQEPFRILEIGLGTHLNVLLTFDHLNTNFPQKTVHYEAIEKFPVPLHILQSLNYSSYVQRINANLFNQLIELPMNQNHQLTNHFNLEKTLVDLIGFESEYPVDLIYFDAFGPNTQPEMWTLEIFEKLFRNMKNKSTLVTYCASGQVRRNMLSVGFEVERIPGPPGKREMLRATKIDR